MYEVARLGPPRCHSVFANVFRWFIFSIAVLPGAHRCLGGRQVSSAGRPGADLKGLDTKLNLLLQGLGCDVGGRGRQGKGLKKA